LTRRPDCGSPVERVKDNVPICQTDLPAIQAVIARKLSAGNRTERGAVTRASRPAMELKGFQRLTLEPGERKTVTFRLAIDQLAFHDRAMRLVVEPGTFTVMIGRSSADIRLTGAFEVTGPTKVIPSQRRFFTETAVE